MIRLLNVYASRSGFSATQAWRGRNTKQIEDLVLWLPKARRRSPACLI
jgi:hypothetical protein